LLGVCGLTTGVNRTSSCLLPICQQIEQQSDKASKEAVLQSFFHDLAEEVSAFQKELFMPLLTSVILEQVPLDQQLHNH
jgi:hypothetical protein